MKTKRNTQINHLLLENELKRQKLVLKKINNLKANSLVNLSILKYLYI